jgi:hypothetical protein
VGRGLLPEGLLELSHPHEPELFHRASLRQGAWPGKALRAAFLLLALALLGLGAPGAARAEGGLELGYLTLDNKDGHILVRLGLSTPGLAQVKAALDEGSELGLNCKVRLIRKRALLPDSTAVSYEFTSKLKANTLSQEYAVDAPGAGRSVRGRDLAALLDRAWGAIALDLGPWSDLSPGDYSLELALSLKRRDVPSFLRYSLFFWSWDVLPEARFSLDFTY